MVYTNVYNLKEYNSKDNNELLEFDMYVVCKISIILI